MKLTVLCSRGHASQDTKQRGQWLSVRLPFSMTADVLMHQPFSAVVRSYSAGMHKEHLMGRELAVLPDVERLGLGRVSI